MHDFGRYSKPYGLYWETHSVYKHCDNDTVNPMNGTDASSATPVRHTRRKSATTSASDVSQHERTLLNALPASVTIHGLRFTRGSSLFTKAQIQRRSVAELGTNHFDDDGVYVRYVWKPLSGSLHFFDMLFQIDHFEHFLDQRNVDDFVLYVWGNEHESSFSGTRWTDVPDSITEQLTPSASSGIAS